MKRVLVIGASGQIGQAVTADLVADFDVVAHWHKTELKMPLGLADTVQFDLTNHLAVQQAVISLKSDILVNCAGIQINARAMNIDPSDWNRIVAVNLTAPFLLTKHALPAMIRQNYGRIIHVSSMAGHLPLLGASAYTATKAGLEVFVRSAAADVAKRGVTINCVAPGILNVGLGADLKGKGREAFLSRIPGGEPGRTADVAKTVRFLIDSPYVTGQSVRVDGGMW